MSTQMKGFLTTLDLVMQDKVKPETVVEEDEVEETLAINEDGELINEKGADIFSKSRRPNKSSGSWWSGDLDASEFAIKDARSKVDDFKSFPKDPKPNLGDVEGSKLAKSKAKQPLFKPGEPDDWQPEPPEFGKKRKEFKVRQGPTVWRGNPNINPDPEGLTGREAEHDERGMKDWYDHNKRIQKRKDKLSGKHPSSKLEPLEPLERDERESDLRRRLEKALGHKIKQDYIDSEMASQDLGHGHDPDSDWIEPLAKPKRTLGDKLKALPGWYLDSLKDAGSSLYKAYAPQGVKDYANRRKDAFSKIMQDDISLEEFTDSANFLLEDYELAKQAKLNEIRRHAGLAEAKPGSMGTAFGKNQWRVEEEGDGWQAYVWVDEEWKKVGESFDTQQEAEAFAKNAKYDTDRHAAKVGEDTSLQEAEMDHGDKLLELVDDGNLDPMMALTMCIKWMTNDEVGQMLDANELSDRFLIQQD